MIFTYPKVGSFRVKKRFALFPEYCEDIPKNNRIWFEWYYVIEEYAALPRGWRWRGQWRSIANALHEELKFRNKNNGGETE